MKNITGENIKRNRVLKNLSMRELAEKIGVSTSAIQKYENGSVSPTMEILSRIASALEISISHLLGTQEVYDINEIQKIVKEMLEENAKEWLDEGIQKAKEEYKKNIKKSSYVDDFMAMDAKLEIIGITLYFDEEDNNRVWLDFPDGVFRMETKELVRLNKMSNEYLIKILNDTVKENKKDFTSTISKK